MELPEKRIPFFVRHPSTRPHRGIGAHGRSISDGKVVKFAHRTLPGHTDLFHSRLRWAAVAPLNDLIHPVLIAFKESLYGAVPAVLNPAFDSKSRSHLLSMVAEEDSLDSAFNHEACSYLLHIDLAGMCPAGPLS